MRHFLTALMCGALTAGVSAAERTTALKNEIEKVSYSVGMNIGGTLKQREMEIDLDIMVSAIRDVLGDVDLLLTEQEARQVLITYNQSQAKRVAEKRMRAANVFLEANKKLEGVQTTESGLQYKVYVDGTGPKPTANDTVLVHYRGTLPDGTEFDNSYSKGTGPAKFGVSRVIKGWTEALQMMSVGSKWQLVIPPDLGYGERGFPSQRIPANSVLLFDIELIAVEPGQPPAPALLAPAKVKTTSPKPAGGQK